MVVWWWLLLVIVVDGGCLVGFVGGLVVLREMVERGVHGQEPRLANGGLSRLV